MNYRLLRRALFRLAKAWGDPEEDAPRPRSPIVVTHSFISRQSKLQGDTDVPHGHVAYTHEMVDPNTFQGNKIEYHPLDEHGYRDAGRHPEVPEGDTTGKSMLTTSRIADVSATHLHGHTIFTHPEANIYDAHTEAHARAHLESHPEHADNRVHVGVTPTPFRLSELADTHKMIASRWPQGSIPLFMHTGPGQTTDHPTYHEMDSDNDGSTPWPDQVGLHSQREMPQRDVVLAHGSRGMVGKYDAKAFPVATQRQWMNPSRSAEVKPDDVQSHIANIPLHHIAEVEAQTQGFEHASDGPPNPHVIRGIVNNLRQGVTPVRTPINPMLVHSVSQAEITHANDFTHTMATHDGERPITAKVGTEVGVSRWPTQAYIARLHQYVDQARDLPRHEPDHEED